jgi:dsRNA-specific ribonuclease
MFSSKLSQNEKSASTPKNNVFGDSSIQDDDIILQKTSDGKEIAVFDPYNTLNHVIEKEDIEKILRTYGINEPINNIELYRRAFVHKSYIKRKQLDATSTEIIIVPKPDDCMPLFSKSNERLEYLGDGLLECVTKYYLYCRFLKKDEGFMTEKKIALVKNESIGKIAMEIGLNNWFIISKYAESKKFRNNLKKLGCLFESFLGAIFLDFNKQDYDTVFANENGGGATDIDTPGDTPTELSPLFDLIFSSVSGFKAVQTFVKNVFEKHVDWVELIQSDHNYKNILQVIIQKEFKVTPQYLEIKKGNDVDSDDSRGGPHAPTGFHMGVYLCLSSTTKSTPLTIGSKNAARDIQTYLAGEELDRTLFSSFKDIHDYYEKTGKVFLMLGEGIHGTKKEAEQIACERAIQFINNNWVKNL